MDTPTTEKLNDWEIYEPFETEVITQYVHTVTTSADDTVTVVNE